MTVGLLHPGEMGRLSAVRNLMAAGGVDQAVAMRISGHRTVSTFQRYRIVSDDVHAALARTEAATRALAEGTAKGRSPAKGTIGGQKQARGATGPPCVYRKR
jgi:hypothetical protein